MTSRNPDLEAQIAEDPDDAAAYLVYGDWLQAAGDPRGKLIAAQAARAANPGSAELAAVEAELLASHRDELLGPSLAIEPAPSIGWHLGFWRSLSIGAADDHIASMLATASARFLRELYVDGAATAEITRLLAPLHRTLEVIDLALRPHGHFSDDDLLALEPCKRVRRLKLYSCAQLTERGFAALRSLHRLADIDLRNCPLDDARARCLDGLPLAHVMFNVVTPAFTAIGMRALSRGPLVSLTLRGESIDDVCIAPLAGHPTLAHVELPDAALGVEGARTLGALSRLRVLHLPSSGLDDASIHALASSAAGADMHSLSVAHSSGVGDEACRSLARFTELTFLDLSATAVRTRGLQHLRSLRALEQLDLGFLDLRDSDVGELAIHAKLRGLSLAFSREVTDRAVDVLEQFRALESLDLSGTAITKQAIDRLARLPNLVELGLDDCDSDVIAHAQSFNHWYVNSRDQLELDNSELYAYRLS